MDQILNEMNKEMWRKCFEAVGNYAGEATPWIFSVKIEGDKGNKPMVMEINMN